jgi:hypothetical protein
MGERLTPERPSAKGLLEAVVTGDKSELLGSGREVVPEKRLLGGQRRYPLVLGSWKGIYREEVRLELPGGYEPLGELPNVELECPAGAFRLSGRRDEAVILEKVLELRAIEVGPADYAKFREFLHAAFKAEQEQLVLRSKME